MQEQILVAQKKTDAEHVRVRHQSFMRKAPFFNGFNTSRATL